MARGSNGSTREERATKHKIPVYAMIIRESLKEVPAPTAEAVFSAVDDVIARLKRVIQERTTDGNLIIVVGVDNK